MHGQPQSAHLVEVWPLVFRQLLVELWEGGVAGEAEEDYAGLCE